MPDLPAGVTDWVAWHAPYADPRSPLSRRLRLVQAAISTFLDARPGPVSVISACAGQGHDVLGVLSGRPDAGRVRATLLEADPRNVVAARAAAAGLPGVTVRCADAGDPLSYAGAVPADLVLLVGVFGNVPDDDVRRTVEALPQLCAPGATVIWTRSRREPDLTPALRGWLCAAGLVEQAFSAPDDVLFTVGVHSFRGTPRPLAGGGRLFTFTG